MNMLLRERRSYAREFVEVPSGFRRTIEDAIEGLIAVLDQLDADPDLEDDDTGEPTLGWPNAHPGGGAAALTNEPPFEDGEFEPTCGWTTAEAAYGVTLQGPDEAEDGFDDEESGDESEYELGWTEDSAGRNAPGRYGGMDEENLTAPETSRGFVQITTDYRQEAEFRELFDCRLALRPIRGAGRRLGYGNPIPLFPYEKRGRLPFSMDDDFRRLRDQVISLRTRRKPKGKASGRRARKSISPDVLGSFLHSHRNCVITPVWPDLAMIPEISLVPPSLRSPQGSPSATSSS